LIRWSLALGLQGKARGGGCATSEYLAGLSGLIAGD
jgi:hypothetical protein